MGERSDDGGVSRSPPDREIPQKLESGIVVGRDKSQRRVPPIITQTHP